MKTITQLQLDFISLYEQMYGFVPTFGTIHDWNNPGWLGRMYDDLYKTYNSLPDEYVGWATVEVQVSRGTWFHVIKNTPI